MVQQSGLATSVVYHELATVHKGVYVVLNCHMLYCNITYTTPTISSYFGRRVFHPAKSNYRYLSIWRVWRAILTIGGVQPPSFFYLLLSCVRATTIISVCERLRAGAPCVHDWFRVFHGHVPMWNRFMEPPQTACQCVVMCSRRDFGSTVPRKSKQSFVADRGPWLFVKGL